LWDWTIVAKDGAPWAIIAFGVLSMIKGWLIPVRWHRERIQDYKDANALLRDTVREKDIQIGILLGSRAKEIV